MPQSDLERAIAKYREDLLANESRATIAIANAYKATRARLVKRIEDLADAIAEDGAEFTPSQVLKWQRAKTLLRQVEAEMATLATASSEPIQQAQATAVEMAGEQAKGLAVATAQSAGADAIAATIDTTWNRLNTGAAEAMVGRMSDGSPLDTWLDQFGAKASGILSESLQSAAALGTNPRAVARELAKQLDISAARLLLTSRTEILGAQRSAAMLYYKNNEDLIDGWYWIGALQAGRTCLSCLSLIGQFFPLSVEFQATHPACRCSSRPSVKGVDFSKRVPKGSDWFNAQPEAVKRDMIPKALWDDYQSGAIVLSDFRHLHEDERWGASYRTATIPEAKANANRRENGLSDVVPKSEPAMTFQPAKTIDEAVSYSKSLGVGFARMNARSRPSGAGSIPTNAPNRIDISKVDSEFNPRDFQLQGNANTRRWIETAPRDEFEAIENYKASGYSAINNHLRFDKEGFAYIGPNSTKTPAETLVARIDSAISANTLPSDAKLYRGMTYADDEWANLKPGSLIKDKGFVSTTYDVDVANSFSGGSEGSYFLTIYAPSGSKGMFLDEVYQGVATKEAEVLLPRGTVFRVVETKPYVHPRYGVRGTKEIVLEVLP